jgi:hypothetical protein
MLKTCVCTLEFSFKVCFSFEVAFIDLKFGSNEFHQRIVDEKKTIWKMFLIYILVELPVVE